MISQKKTSNCASLIRVWCFYSRLFLYTPQRPQTECVTVVLCWSEEVVHSLTERELVCVCVQTFREPVSDYQVVREKAATQRRDVERALTRFMAKTGETQSLFKDDITAFPCEWFCPRWPPSCSLFLASYFSTSSNPAPVFVSDRSTAQHHPIPVRPPAVRAGASDSGGDGFFWAGRPDGQREHSRKHHHCELSPPSAWVLLSLWEYSWCSDVIHSCVLDYVVMLVNQTNISLKSHQQKLVQLKGL